MNEDLVYIVISIYKKNGKIQNCDNYRGITLLSRTMKLWKMVIERRLRSDVVMSEK